MAVSWESYWKYQTVRWRQHDTYSCWCKLVILAGNLAIPSTKEQPELKYDVLRVKSAAVAAFVCVAVTLVLIIKQQHVYSRLRSSILLLHRFVIGTMVYLSLPVYGGPHAEQVISSSDNLVVSLLQQLLNLVFRSGAMFCVMGTLMHRQPWQLVFSANAVYVLLISCSWARPFCSAIIGQPALYSEPRSCSHISGFTRNERPASASFSSNNIERNRIDVSSTAELVSYLASGLDYITGQGELQGGVWVPRAHDIAAHCRPGSSSSETCRDMLQGQCVAVVVTLNVWLGVLLLGFCVVMLEQTAKWQYLQKHSGQAQTSQFTPTDDATDQVPGSGSSGVAGSSSASAAAASSSSIVRSSSDAVLLDVPLTFKTPSKGKFIWDQMLRFHVMLDVPLLLLWAGLSWLLRPGL